MEVSNAMAKIQNKNANNGKIFTPATNKVVGFFNANGVHKMLFNNKKTAKELPPLFSESEISGATYDQVQDFLVAVNDGDFDKIIQVAKIYRQANKDVAAATGMEFETQPSIFERQEAPAVTIPETDTEAGNFLDNDDDLAAAFLNDDEPKTTIPVKTTATAKTAKNETANLQS